MSSLKLMVLITILINLIPVGVGAASIQNSNTHPHRYLTLRITGQKHPSGIYHPGQHAVLNISITNQTEKSRLLQGKLRWTFRRTSQKSSHDHWHTLAAVEIQAARVPVGARFMLPVPVSFSKVGFYRLVYQDRAVKTAFGVNMLCNYPPRGRSIPAQVSPWITNIPRAFVHAHPTGFIGDYIRQTAIRRYLLRFHWPVDPLRDSFFHSAAAFDRLGDISKSFRQNGAVLVLDIILRKSALTMPDACRIFSLLIRRLVQTTGNRACALAIHPFKSPHDTPRQRQLLQTLCITGYRVARSINPQILRLGLPSLYRLGFGAVAKDGSTPLGIIDVAALPSRQKVFFKHLNWVANNTPVWVLPQGRRRTNTHAHTNISSALALAQGAVVVPNPLHDDGMLIHLLGDAALFHIVHPALPPYIAVFQANHHSVAVIAGPAAATARASQWSAWRYWPVVRATTRQNDKPKTKTITSKSSVLSHIQSYWPIGKLIVLDPANNMVAMDGQGQLLPTPIAGWHEMPLNSQVLYLKANGSASDMVAALRTATITGLPPLAIAIFPDQSSRGSVMVAIRNARIGRLHGAIRLLYPDVAGNRGSYMKTRWHRFGPIASGRTLLMGPIPPLAAHPLVKPTAVQIRRAGEIWQTNFSSCDDGNLPPAR